MLKGKSSSSILAHPALKKRSILLLALRHKYLPGCFLAFSLPQYRCDFEVLAKSTWEDIGNLWEETALDKEAVIIGDADREMRNALVKGERRFQLDLIHVFRDTSFKLWQDREMTLEDRKRIIRRLETLLFSLKNSVEKHRKDRNLDALKGRTSKPFSPFSSSISIGLYEPCIPTTSTVSPSTPCHDISAIGGLSG